MRKRIAALAAIATGLGLLTAAPASAYTYYTYTPKAVYVENNYTSALMIDRGYTGGSWTTRIKFSATETEVLTADPAKDAKDIPVSGTVTFAGPDISIFDVDGNGDLITSTTNSGGACNEGVQFSQTDLTATKAVYDVLSDCTTNTVGFGLDPYRATVGTYTVTMTVGTRSTTVTYKVIDTASLGLPGVYCEVQGSLLTNALDQYNYVQCDNNTGAVYSRVAVSGAGAFFGYISDYSSVDPYSGTSSNAIRHYDNFDDWYLDQYMYTPYSGDVTLSLFLRSSTSRGYNVPLGSITLPVGGPTVAAPVDPAVAAITTTNTAVAATSTAVAKVQTDLAAVTASVTALQTAMASLVASTTATLTLLTNKINKIMKKLKIK